MKTRDDVRSGQPRQQTPTQTTTTTSDTSPPVKTQSVESMNIPQPSTPQAPAPDSFLTKEPPKVGVILGPGGLRAYAHIGALKEMAKARLPIRAIVGLEWGAIMGGLYAMQGQANEVEWKAFKLREDDIPSMGGGLLHRGLQPEKVGELGNFLSTVFAGQNVEKAKIEFACPAYNINTDRFLMGVRGGFKEVVSRCAGYPPLYTDSDGWLGAPLAIDEAVHYLRSKGINLIIYVNALGGGTVIDEKIAQENYGAKVLWAEARRQSSRTRTGGADIVINVDTGSHSMTDYASRRQMMESGAKAARDVMSKLVTQYGF